MLRPWLAIFAVVLGLGLSPVRAHEPGLSSATLRIQPKAIDLVVVFAPVDLQWALPSAHKEGGAHWIMDNSEAARSTLNEIGRQAWQVEVAGKALVSTSCTVTVEPAENNVSYHLVFPLSVGGEAEFESTILSKLSLGHREFLTVIGPSGQSVNEKLLSAESPRCAFTVENTGGGGSEAAKSVTFWSFVRLGVEHILTGYDHLLFLFGLLIVCRRISSILAIITCFTVAHSITLALAAFNVVSLPSQIVEPAIAASIVFVGIENLLRREDPRGRKVLTFLFGLVHGFGFASALRELGLGTSGRGLLVPLFSFNFGVEIGQIAVASAILPILWWLRKTRSFSSRWMPALSAIVAAAGLYWLVERTVFS